MDKYENKLDEIAGDVAYMRGKWDEAIPLIQNTVKEQGVKIVGLEKSQASIKTKVGIAGGFAGLLGSGVIEWIVQHFKLK